MIDTVDAYAPNFRRSVLGYKALSPLDLEREYGLVGGDIFHGSLGLDQLFSARPLLGQGNYRGALPGLYLCGSGTHPGGGVTGLPGRNAARGDLAGSRARAAAGLRLWRGGKARRGRRPRCEQKKAPQCGAFFHAWSNDAYAVAAAGMTVVSGLWPLPSNRRRPSILRRVSTSSPLPAALRNV